ncbi:MAG: ABC transporter ATP-binding protein, partial [Gillisia sp.]
DALSFADQTIVLKNGKVHAKDAPKQLYDNPKDTYVASLFGDVNTLSLKNLVPSEKSRKKILLYPHEIKVVSGSYLNAQVLRSYFKGRNFLVKAALNGEVIYFEHSRELAKGEIVAVEVSGELINSRMRN